MTYAASAAGFLAALLVLALVAPSASARGGGITVGGGPQGNQAKLTRSGDAVAPVGAPDFVKQVIAAANRIDERPYVYGGGHSGFKSKGYDCSGAVSYALHGAGLLSSPLDSTGLARFGVRGKGRWISVYANPSHAYLIVAGLRFDTANTVGDGPRWSADLTSTPGRFRVRHPA